VAVVRLGDIANPDAAGLGKPLDGVRILALEQMQALPFATQLLARLGAEVVKVEHPVGGDQGRGALPAMEDPEGRRVGATFLRNNLNKRSVCIDLKDPAGRQLVLTWPRSSTWWPRTPRPAPWPAWASATTTSPPCTRRSSTCRCPASGTAADALLGWPAFAPVAEAMSGIYEFKRQGDRPVVAPVGALGDIGTALFATVGVLAALRHRDRTGEGQHVDVAMLDAMVAMTDLVTNFWSMGLTGGDLGPLIMHGFRGRRRLVHRPGRP
jgi:crotonobetainyl-CoA:carnitine CoA-transferase CaiB-like acyl-CoA transferase